MAARKPAPRAKPKTKPSTKSKTRAPTRRKGAASTMAARKPSRGAPTTPEALIAALPEPRRGEMQRLHELIRAAVPALTAVVDHVGIGYGPFHYRYASGREGDACRIGLASRKQYIAIYCLAADDRGYVAERYRERLPAADIGKSCVRFKRVDDLDRAALVALLKETAATGFGI